MKLANRIFLFFSALSVISLVQFDAMGVAYDESADCTSNATPGYYCQKAGKKPACPVGCYCPGGVKTAVGDNSQNFGQVKSACENHWSGEVKAYLEARGIYYCPDDFPTTATSTSYTRGQCKTKGSPVIYLEAGAADCTNTPEAGKYCKTAGTHNSCPSGCYCPGGSKEAAGTDINVGKACTKGNTFYPSRLNLANVYKCPDRFPFSDSGAEDINECYDIYNTTDKLHYKQLNCDVGYYLPKLAEECSPCPTGYRCPGTGFRRYWLPSKNEDQGNKKCEDNKIPNTDHTECVSSSSGGNGGNVSCNYTVTYRNNYPISNIASVTANDLRAELSAMEVGEPTFDAPANSNRLNRPVATQNPQPQTMLCQGDPVTLPNAPTAPNGYTFNYWGCNKGFGHKVPGETFNMPAGNVICTAQWTVDTGGSAGNGTGGSTGGGTGGSSYTVTYDCNGGTGLQVDPHSPYTSGYNVTVLANNSCMAPSGKTFDKWSCNGTVVTPGNQFTITENTTCKAQWKNDTDQTVHCPQGGEYWNGNVCADCPMGAYCPVNDDERHECENNTYSNTTGNAVCTACPVGETAINNHTDCTSNQTVTCGEGKYLPAGSSNCVQCPDGYGCSGGTFEIKNFNQGREQCMPDRVSCQNYSACCYCPDGSNPNDTYSGCVNSNGTVVLPEDPTPVSCTTAGKYWDGDGCITCESGYFCPGNGQHYKCPFGGASTQNKASCVLNLNETQMEYNKCWLRYWNNAAAYRKCLYGIDLATLPH